MSSTFPTRAAFARQLAAPPSRLPYGATSGFTARSAHRFATMGSQPMASRLRFSWTPRGVTEGAWLPVCSTALRVGSFHPTGEAPPRGAQLSGLGRLAPRPVAREHAGPED